MENQDGREGLIANNKVDEDEEDQDDEDHESGIKEDILRPASTRSKIVVNLKEPPS